MFHETHVFMFIHFHNFSNADSQLEVTFMTTLKSCLMEPMGMIPKINELSSTRSKLLHSMKMTQVPFGLIERIL